MKAVASTGLVPVQVGERVFGVPPAIAAKGIDSGEFVLVEIPDGIETIDVAGVKPPEKQVEPVEVSLDGLVAIPENWRSVHGGKRAMIAKAILGLEPKESLPTPEGVEISQFAIEVIEREVARREALLTGNQSELESPPQPEAPPAGEPNQTGEIPPVVETNPQTPAQEPAA